MSPSKINVQRSQPVNYLEQHHPLNSLQLLLIAGTQFSFDPHGRKMIIRHRKLLSAPCTNLLSSNRGIMVNHLQITYTFFINVYLMVSSFRCCHQQIHIDRGQFFSWRQTSGFYQVDGDHRGRLASYIGVTFTAYFLAL